MLIQESRESQEGGRKEGGGCPGLTIVHHVALRQEEQLVQLHVQAGTWLMNGGHHCSAAGC